MLPGKHIDSVHWIHVSAIGTLPSEITADIQIAMDIANVSQNQDFNVVKFDREQHKITLLDYPNFYDIAFPLLSRYWTVNLDSQTVRFRTYENSINPPLLHRKELLLLPSAPERKIFTALTTSAEAIGLFDDPRRIGFRRSWDELLEKRGYRVVGHELIPIGNDEALSELASEVLPDEGIARHRTALTRHNLSAPIQTLSRFGYLDGSKTIFDYGCGRGDDIRNLVENEIEASGWDPYHAPDEVRKPADIVNLGFVINVIEDISERIEALSGAYKLANDLLVVSAMLANQDSIKGTPYADGVLTTRSTFQKYYSQDELRHFITEVLDDDPIPVGPGIFYIFKDKTVEQQFLYERQTNRRNILRLSYLTQRSSQAYAARAEQKYQSHKEILERLWESCLTFGRDPHHTEVTEVEYIRSNFGSLPAALRFIKSRKGNIETILAEAQHSRIDDLLVYFALQQFSKRKPYTHLDARLQRDVKVFFGSYRSALDAGRALLFKIADISAIEAACHWASEHGIGHLEEGKSLQLHTSMVVQLPPILRTYVGCGIHLYGDVSSADLIKIHIQSGKLTLIKFDDFENKGLPRMIQRVKLNLKEQDLDIFDYGEDYSPPYLFHKSRYIDEEFAHYAEQVALDEELEESSLFDFSGYGPSPEDFNTQLGHHRYQLDGFTLSRSRTIPDLGDPCGNYFTYRDFIECGETQAQTRIANLPKEPDTYTALYDLAVNVLDPIIDYFGMIKLTYGFCSPELARKIPGGIAPKLDQHASHEKSSRGNLICNRLGAAVDFIVEDENMYEVAYWISTHLSYDRVYLYGERNPIHISFSAENKREIYEMKKRNSGAIMPSKWCYSS